MLINPLTLMSLGTSLLGGTNPVSAAVDGVSSALGGIGDLLTGQFSGLLQQDSKGLTLVSQEPVSFDPSIVANNLAGQNLPTNLKPIEQQTLNYIEQVLNGGKVLDGQNGASTTNGATDVATATTLTESQSEIFSKIQKFLDENKDQIAQANEDEIKGLVDIIGKMLATGQTAATAAAAQNAPTNNTTAVPTTVVTDPSATAQASQVQAPQLLEPKQDPRLLGKDNLQNAVSNSDDRSSQITTGLLDNKKSVFDDALSKASNGDTDLIGGKYTGIEQMNKNNIDSRFAALNNTAVVRYTSSDAPGSYGIAKINKQSGRIEVVLEPASLGKVDIKIDFHADGKTTMMVSADKKETLDLLQKDAKYFEKILADNGIKADSGSLSFNMRNPNNGTEFAGYSGQEGGNLYNKFNIAVPNDSITANENNNYSSLNAYMNVQSVNGLNILV